MFVLNSTRLIPCRIMSVITKQLSGTLINRQISLFSTPGMCHFLKLGWLSPLSSYVTTLVTLPHWDTQADQKILQKVTARLFLFEPLQKHKSPFPQRWSVPSLNVKSADWLQFPPFWSAVFTLLADIWGWQCILLAICVNPDQTARIHRLRGCPCWSCLCWSQMS